MFNFLKNLFKGETPKPKSTIPKNQKRNTKKSHSVPSKELITNAPAHWPKLKVDNSVNMFPAGDPRNWLTSSLMHAGAIIKTLKDHHGIEGKTSYKENIDLVEGDLATSSSVQQLCSLGVLKVDVAVREKDKKYAVIVFQNGLSRATVNGINKALEPYGYNELIWYAPDQPSLSGPLELPTMRFDRTSMTYIKDYKSKHAQYALWWSSPEDLTFSTSKAAKYITDAYSVMDGYETSMNGLFGVMFKLHPQIDRVELPDDLVIPFEGPGSEIILLGIGKKRGFNFYFPVNARMTTYRDDFLREFVPFCKEMIDLMKGKNYKQDKWPNMPIEWWRQRLAKAKEDEAKSDDARLFSVFEPIRKNNPHAN